MIELIKSWLVGITCAAMVVALAEGLMPDGVVRKVGRLTGALVMLLAVIQPVLQVDGAALASSLTQYRAQAAGYSQSLEEENQELMKKLIAEQAGAYILDKAQALGAAPTSVTVTTEPGEGDYPIPSAVTVRGDLTEQQIAALTRQIAADFAIPAQRQTYITEDVE